MAKKKKEKNKSCIKALLKELHSLIFINVTSCYVFLQKLHYTVSIGKLTDILSCVVQTHINLTKLVIQIICVILKPFQAE